MVLDKKARVEGETSLRLLDVVEQGEHADTYTMRHITFTRCTHDSRDPRDLFCMFHS
jgi:hypothetical protein